MTEEQDEPAAALAAALRAYFSPEQLAELRIGAAALGAGSHRPGATVWFDLADVVDQVEPAPAGVDATRAQVVVPVVNDLGIDPAREPVVVYANSGREGQPLIVLLESTGERVHVVPPGEAWRPIPGQTGSAVQRLWIGRPD
jgi:hypothetical protein